MNKGGRYVVDPKTQEVKQVDGPSFYSKEKVTEKKKTVNPIVDQNQKKGVSDGA